MPPASLLDAPTMTAAPTPAAAKPPRVRLEFLDGIRGLAAFYVVFHHVSQIYMGERVLPAAGYYWFTPWMQLGHYAVAIFIVLSGFCLMLPVANSADGTLRGGFLGYVWRRVRRIVPAYYAAMAMCFPARPVHPLDAPPPTANSGPPPSVPPTGTPISTGKTSSPTCSSSMPSTPSGSSGSTRRCGASASSGSTIS